MGWSYGLCVDEYPERYVFFVLLWCCVCINAHPLELRSESDTIFLVIPFAPYPKAACAAMYSLAT